MKTSRAIIFDNDRLLVLYREKIKDFEKISYYAIPGGHVEEGETLEETCVRELSEELNIDIEILGYLGMMVVNGVEEYYFHGKIISGKPLLGGEELERNCPDNYYEFRYLPISELDDSGIKSIKFVKNAIRGIYDK